MSDLRLVNTPPPTAAETHARIAHEHRGPWWWRLRCRLAQHAGNLACALEPDDKSSMSWLTDDGKHIVFATIRRPPDDNERKAGT